MTTVTLHEGDNIEKMRAMPANSVDAIVTDPPYLLTSIAKRFGADNAAPAKFGRDGAFSRASAGFMGSKWDAPNVELPIDPGFAYWFAGFVDGEGCFTVNHAPRPASTYSCQFAIVVRDDDRDILVECQKQLGGIGTLKFDKPNGNPNAGPQARWTVSSKQDCLRLRQVLSVFPLRAKKLRDFEIWSQALDAWLNHGRGDWSDMEFFKEELHAIKKFGSLYRPDFHFHYRWGREALRVLKPGGYLVSFSGSRTFGRMASALEDAGFITHPMLGWVFGSGFPKAHNAAMAIDKHLGVEGGRGDPKSAAHAGWIDRGAMRGDDGNEGWQREWMQDADKVAANARRYLPGSPEAAQWDGWAYGAQALKPALEPIYVGQKPFDGKTGAPSIIKHGVGALNIDGCRVPATGESRPRIGEESQDRDYGETGTTDFTGTPGIRGGAPEGRHPANLLHDGSEDVVALFPQSTSGAMKASTKRAAQDEPGSVCYGTYGGQVASTDIVASSGSAARFFNAFPADEPYPVFYHAKAGKADRAGSKHPTVKPIALMRWLCRLVTPPGSTVLDPFAGSGTTGAAALAEGFVPILMEGEPNFATDIRNRFALPAPAGATCFDDLLGSDNDNGLLDLEGVLG